MSEELQSGQDNRLTEKWARAASEEENSQASSVSPKASTGSSNLEDTTYDTNVASLLTPRRTSITKDFDKTCGHATTHYDYLMEKQVSTEGIYMDHCTYSGHHVNATTQEIKC